MKDFFNYTGKYEVYNKLSGNLTRYIAYGYDGVDEGDKQLADIESKLLPHEEIRGAINDTFRNVGW